MIGGTGLARAYVRGAFDDLRSADLRFLEEAARLGPLTALLFDDEAAAALGIAPKFSLAERRYYLESLRFVSRVEVGGPDALPRGALLALREEPDPAGRERLAAMGVAYRVIGEAVLGGFDYEPPPLGALAAGRPRVIVTGCYDWFHTGHVRFFEEASAYGELNVVIGSDANVRLLKGEGHPLFPEAERRYVVGAVRFVSRCLVSTGSGWLDAEPEIRALKPARYVVNADGDKPEKRRYCEENGIEYIVLERRPKEGLPRRTSTDLRGF